MEYLQQISKGKYVISSCMMRQEGDNMVYDWNFGGCVEDRIASNLMNSVGCLISKYFF